MESFDIGGVAFRVGVEDGKAVFRVLMGNDVISETDVELVGSLRAAAERYRRVTTFKEAETGGLQIVLGEGCERGLLRDRFVLGGKGEPSGRVLEPEDVVAMLKALRSRDLSDRKDRELSWMRDELQEWCRRIEAELGRRR